MAQTVPRNILDVASSAWQQEQLELAEAARLEQVRVVAKTATGSGDIEEVFSLDLNFRLAFVRCHFVGGSGHAELQISVDSAQGSAYDTRLFTVKVAGAGADVNLRVPHEESRLPSPWALQPGDTFRINWTNPDPGNTTWGLEVGLTPA
ncbi:MAG: hypothetical protein GY778_17930 [bacterium]|nr:hypothetical protein [bacterium]